MTSHRRLQEVNYKTYACHSLKYELTNPYRHDDVIKWKHFSSYWSFVWRIHRSRPVTPNLDFFYICTRINGWVNNREAGDFRRNRAHYGVIVMEVFVHCKWNRIIRRSTIKSHLSFSVAPKFVFMAFYNHGLKQHSSSCRIICARNFAHSHIISEKELCCKSITMNTPSSNLKPQEIVIWRAQWVLGNTPSISPAI